MTAGRPRRRLLGLLPVLLLGGLLMPALLSPPVAAAGCTSGGEPTWGRDAGSRNLTISDQRDPFDEFGDGEEIDEFQEPFFLGEVEPALRPLTRGLHTSHQLASNASWALLVNLTTGYRYTFCVSTVAYDADGNITSGQPEVDVYLMKASDWDSYTYEADEDGWYAQAISQIPPEWRSAIQWTPYRDVHGYEKTADLEFSVALDKLELSSADPFSGSGATQRPFYLVIDGIDNSRGTDAGVSPTPIGIDVGVQVEDRLLLPNYTVALVCGLGLLAVAAIPVALHVSFGRAGSADVIDLMPSLTQAPEAAAPPAHAPPAGTPALAPPPPEQP